MGEDSRNAASKADCRSHDDPNLHITDASMLSWSGGAESPSLTIHAPTRSPPLP
ncbi:hypothetical protein [Parazoarcus communis]|uniref:hypothetical protein n=1 Tax=Parazoarcus communis TaxID=41977 RepID=UPI000D59A13E|nr:hypothetical protein [Parazoarcus communis]